MILNEVSLKVQAGEFVYLLGATGSGKSSFLRLLFGDLPLLEGEARIFDIDLARLDRDMLPILRRQLGVVASEYPLLEHKTLEANFQLVLMATDWLEATQRKDRIIQVLALLNLGHRLFAYPSELTKAEYQKALIARALLNQPALLLIDEPTALLDTEATLDILSFLHSFSQATHTAVILATVDSKITEHFPGRVLRCGAGRINIIQQLPPPAAG